MESIFDSLKTKKVRAIKGDFIDKLHSQVTVTFLIAISILIGLKQSSDSSIYCWLPKFLSGAQEEYVHQFCWINSTYMYLDENNPQKFAQHPKTSIPYYQYMLFILFAQWFLFYIPSLLWGVLASDSIGYIDKLLDMVDRSRIISSGVQKFQKAPKNMEKKEINVNLSKVSETDELLREEKSLSRQNTDNSLTRRMPSIIPDETKSLFIDCAKNSLNKMEKDGEDVKSKNKFRKLLQKGKQKLYMGSMKPKYGVKGLAAKYLLIKTFNLLNVIIQLTFMSLIFGKDFLTYGLTYFHQVWYTHNPLLLSRQFPYMSLCDYYVHMPSLKVHETTVQCLLSINILIEKFYILIWFWYWLLIVVTAANLLSWFYEIYCSSKAKLICKYLEIHQKMYGSSSVDDLAADKAEKLNAHHALFQNEYLGNDGLVMLLMIKSVAGDIAFIELLQILWLDFQSK